MTKTFASLPLSCGFAQSPEYCAWRNRWGEIDGTHGLFGVAVHTRLIDGIDGSGKPPFWALCDFRILSGFVKLFCFDSDLPHMTYKNVGLNELAGAVCEEDESEDEDFPAAKLPLSQRI